MGGINADWHKVHRMPKNPTPDERIEWHIGHVANCGCRDIPKGVLALMAARGMTPPKPAK